MFLEVGIEQLLEDPDFVRYMEESNQLDAWMSAARAQQELVIEDCEP